MHLWVGLVCAAVATASVVVAGPATVRWASGVDVTVPGWTTALTASVGGFVVGGQLGLVPELAAYEVFAVVCAILVGIDLEVHRLPDRLTAVGAAAGVLLLGAAAAVDGAWGDLGRAIVGGVILLAVYLLLFLAVRSGLGGGDVKLAGVLGLHLGWLGWPTLVLGAFAGFAAGGVMSLGLLAARRATMQTRVPFGPAMVAGALFAVAIGPESAGVLLGW